MKRTPIKKKPYSRKCRICGTRFETWDIRVWWCSSECGAKYAIKKRGEEKEKANRKSRSQNREKLKTRSQKIQDARRVFHKFIRLRDQHKPCISCGTMESPIWDAGHYRKAEIYTGVIFDEDNTAKQCRRCNYFLHGNEEQYRKGLIDRIGFDAVVDLEERADLTRMHKWTDEELEAIKKKYREKIADLKK